MNTARATALPLSIPPELRSLTYRIYPYLKPGFHQGRFLWLKSEILQLLAVGT